jgi:hypothetical protein
MHRYSFHQLKSSKLFNFTFQQYFCKYILYGIIASASDMEDDDFYTYLLNKFIE